jgi:hypothetical protein
VTDQGGVVSGPIEGALVASLFKAQLTVNEFRRGEIIEVLDEDLPAVQRFVDKGWLKPYVDPYAPVAVDVEVES